MASRRNALSVVGLTIAFLAAGVATSHEMPYVQAQPGKPNPSTGVSFSMSVFITSEQCGIANHIILNLSFGGVCFGSTPEQGWGNGNEAFTDALGNPAGSALAQHLTPAGTDQTSVLDVTDSSFALISATYCQNLNPTVDRVCGANSTGAAETGNADPACQVQHPEGLGNCLLRSEPNVRFCDSITIFGGLTGPLSGTDRRASGTAPGSSGSGDWADPSLDNWAIDFEVQIFISSPLGGNTVAGSPCDSNAWGTSGTVSHS